ncbi:MAG: PLP-dependent aminotransferase family protein [Gammaproteobacteria bacterium]|nr:PLP-dependent aminotransferase family protein [Gammaproteobacteria bacterium]NVK88073.1 PLP-dependent aminotransferase family protein [Gammaproteobacteria bacterium]
MAFAVTREHNEFLYQQVINLVRQMREQGTLQPGEKLPSLRSLAAKLSVSVPTVKQGYEELERLGEIEARPKSGYYLALQLKPAAAPRRAKLASKAIAVKKQSLIEQVYDAIHTPGVVPLGIANPVAAYSSEKMLARTMRRVMSQAGQSAINYGPMDGFAPLKRQLALRYLDMGLTIDPADLVITNGAQEALAIALQCVAGPGDIIAVESPCYFGILELIESLGMMAFEIPLCPDDGVWLDDLEQVFKTQKIAAGIFSTAISNPLGCNMPEQNRRALVELMEHYQVPLIEDDVYSDLYFSEHRAIPAQAYSRKRTVITCSSFSKTCAPGYRVGWMIAPRYIEQAKRIKRALSCSSSLINQWTLSEFIASGDYDRNMKQLRRTLLLHRDRMMAIVKQSFPQNTRISCPQGGGVLWIELPPDGDATLLFHQALTHKISIAPGAIFSPSNKYARCFRISYGLAWSEQVEQSIKKLGELAQQQYT